MPTQTVRKARTEALILDAAERLLARGGLADATVVAIAREADVALGTIYARFGSKDGVLSALAARLVAVNEDMLARAREDAESPLGEVVAMLDSYVRFHRDHPIAFRLLGTRALDPALERRLDAMVRQVADGIRRAVDAGEARPVDPLRAARFAWASLNGVLALHARGALPERELRATVAEGREVLVAGLRG